MKEQSFKIINGKEKIILSAPHCVIHKRENSIRPGENKTRNYSEIIIQKM